jgi:hypothetical protein
MIWTNITLCSHATGEAEHNNSIIENPHCFLRAHWYSNSPSCKAHPAPQVAADSAGGLSHTSAFGSRLPEYVSVTDMKSK